MKKTFPYTLLAIKGILVLNMWVFLTDQASCQDSLSNLPTSKPESTRIDSNQELPLKDILNKSRLKLESLPDSVIQSIRLTKGLTNSFNRYTLIQKGKVELLRSLDQLDSLLKVAPTDACKLDMADIKNQLATLYQKAGQSELALELVKGSIMLITSIGASEQLAIAFNIAGNIHLALGNFEQSLQSFNKGLNMFMELDNLEGQADTYLNLGTLHSKIKNHVRSITLTTKSLVIYDSLGLKKQTSEAYNNLGNSHFHLKQIKKAEQNYLKSLKEGISLKSNQDFLTAYDNLGLLYQTVGKLDTAQFFFQQSLDLRKKESLPDQFISEYNLGNIWRIRKRQDLAIQFYESSYKAIDSLKLIKSYPEVIWALAETHSNLGNFDRSLAFRNQYTMVIEMIEADIIKVSNLELLLQEKRNELELIKIRVAKDKLTILSLTGGLIFVFLLFGLTVAYVRTRQKKRLAEKNQRIQEQVNEELLKAQELAALGAVLEAQETERRRIARDLHDRLGSILSMVKIHFKSVENNLSELRIKNKDQYEKGNQLLDEACDEVRKISHDMVSSVLMKFGLVSALRNLFSSVESTGQLKMEFVDFGIDERLSYDYEINIYRIIQELLSNVLKHAQASEMSIQLLKKDSILNILIEDNGIGFDKDTEGFELGMGLKNIESRVHKYGGELFIDSGKGAGTTINIKLETQILIND